jgi:hypothetical protein
MVDVPPINFGNVYLLVPEVYSGLHKLHMYKIKKWCIV